MSKNRRRRTARLRAEATAIERRLERAVVPNMTGPVLGRANIAYELSARTKGTAHGGIGAIAKLIDASGLANEIDASLHLLKLHKPYYESDHVLNIAYNALCGGRRLPGHRGPPLRRGPPRRLGDREPPRPHHRRGLLPALRRRRGARPPSGGQPGPAEGVALPARRLLRAASGHRRRRQHRAHRRCDQTGHGHLLPRHLGYSALVVSLANTKEPLYLALLGANRPSHEGVLDYYDRAIALSRQAGFKEIRLRGDTDFSLTTELDRWDDDGVRFVFGYNARANLIEQAQSTDKETYRELVTRAQRQIATTARTRPRNVKDNIVRERNYKVLRQTAQDVVEFSYRPGNCQRDYRVLALRKNISVERGENVLFCEYRYFFYITNDRDMTADEVIDQARQRCDQENLISQLKSDVRALHAPVNTLCANWAYMTMAALAWSLKAWCALLLPVSPRWAERHNEQRRRLLTIDFRTFLAAFIEIPPDRHHQPARAVAHPRLQPVAGGVLPPPRRPLTNRNPPHRPPARQAGAPATPNNGQIASHERPRTPTARRIAIPTVSSAPPQPC
jgi:hypothetical protein